jgi:hypothetical protein
LLSALLTCATIFFGYATDSLPETVLTNIDKATINNLQGSFVMKTLLPWIGRRWFPLKSRIFRLLGRKALKQRLPIPREQRVAAVTRLVLSLSDQQLVTGLAVLIAALANRCQITMYELRIVFCLAWFSATTHVATWKVLHEYFYANTVVRNWRIMGIAAFLALLCFVQGALISYGTPGYVHESFGLAGVPAVLENRIRAMPLQCVLNGQSLRPTLYPNLLLASTGGVFVGIYLLLLFLLPIYISHCAALFKDPRNHIKDGWSVAFYHLVFRPHRNPTLPAHQVREMFENTNIQQDVLLRQRECLRLTSRIVLLSAGGCQYRLSFLSYLPYILFSISFGISQLISDLIWGYTVDMSHLTFGQVTALALLAIPALAGAEVYNGD